MIHQLINPISSEYQTLTPILQVMQIIASIAVAITLVFTTKTYFKMRNTEQVKISHDIFKLYTDLEKESANLAEQAKPLEERRDWSSRFFNTLEWVSLLVNSKEITNKRLIGFYEPVIMNAYEEIFPKYYSEKEIKDDKIYPEFQELYRNLKEGKIKFYSHDN